MIVTFCGHSDFTWSDEIEKRIMEILEERVGDSPAQFYLGGYGGFDGFAHACCKKYQKTHPKTELILITPYLDDRYLKRRLEYEKDAYDEILYPPIENAPLKYAISHRNKWMVEQSDLVVAYVTHSWGGASQTLQHAKRKRKEIVNLSESNYL